MTDRSLAGRTVVVTGAGGGLGRAMTYALAGAGATVVAVDIDRRALTETATGRPAGTVVESAEADLTDERRVDGLAEELNDRFGGVDVLFANAGISLVKPSLDLTNDELSRVFAVNVLATFATVRAFGRHMLAGRGGKLVLTTSTLGSRGTARWTAYCASKAAVTSMTQSLAAEWGPTVTVNAIAPGAVRTNINARLLDAEFTARLEESSAAGRLVVPDDLGPLAVFLAGPGRDMISGQVLTIDGGRK